MSVSVPQVAMSMDNARMNGPGEVTAERLARAGVTPREAEVLGAVAERLRNREIAARLHLSVRTVESHIAALLHKLGANDRAALVELGAQLRRTAVARSDTALPEPLTSLIGRDSDTSELAALVDTHRLVTLIGPGGVGKTRLALRLATVRADRFPSGARLADLAPVVPELVGDTIARALGVVPEPGWSLRDILREVAGALHCLLLVDNCEHVITQAADIVADLLAASSRMRVLATSREPLGLSGEVVYQVQPLTVPIPGASVRADTAAAYDAVRLFVDRAATAAPGFALTDTTAPALAELCQRLDGLPLAIELAASRVRSFEPAELVQHLDERFLLLSAGVRTAPPRHRTLRGMIDWSYNLLDDDERALFDRLGVFPADFDFEAARAVCKLDSCGAPVMTLLPRLVDKSLVSSATSRTRRYRLLESIRAYAEDRLSVSGAEPATRGLHASYYLALAEQGAEQHQTSQQRIWLDRLSTEQPNLRAALAHSVTTGDIASAWRFVAALHQFWEITGQRREALEWIDRALAIGAPSPGAVAGLAAASEMVEPSDSRAAFELARHAERLAANDDDFTRATAARAVGMGAIWIQPELTLPTLRAALAGFGDDHPWESARTMENLAQATSELNEALQWGRASVALFHRVGDQLSAANTLFNMAQRSIYAGVADDEVHEWLTESQRLAEAAGSDQDQVHAKVGFGQLAWLRGEHEAAARLMAECLPTLRRLGDRRCTARAQYILGERAREQQHLDRADDLLRASVEAIMRAGQSVVLVQALESLAAVCAAQNHPREAAAILGAAHGARNSASAHMRPINPPDEQLHQSLEQILGTDAFDTAHAEGERTPLEQTLQLASTRRVHSR
jgi:predicted ATPase/DNA-binding CsgD family transcriptional regulator